MFDDSPRVAAQGRLAEVLNGRAAAQPGPPVAQRQASLEDEQVLERKTSLEEESTQLRGAAESTGDESAAGRGEPVQRRENRTGLPDNLKAGVESLSGLSMDDVKVHYNSPQPATVQALAYTRGTDIHVGPGQERHLAHEAWHVAQQKQGRVKPTTQLRGLALNDDSALEREADVRGAEASRAKPVAGGGGERSARQVAGSALAGAQPFQLKKILNLGSGTNLANFLREDTVIRAGAEPDEAINVDSGHMLLAELLLGLDNRFFVDLEQAEGLDIKWSALAARERSDSADPNVLRQTRGYKDFVLRAWFEEHPGKAGFGAMLETVGRMVPELARQFQDTILKMESTGSFRQGFAEDLGGGFKREYDEVHVISALGFDLINGEEAIAEVASVLKPGGKLIITAEKTGMVSKALKTRRVQGQPYPVPEVENGHPKIKPGIKLLDYFRYSMAESSYGDYANVFQGNYRSISTSHTTGGGFGQEIPFARLVFILKRNPQRKVKDRELALRDYENAQWLAPEEFGEMSFEEFLTDYIQDL
jgi:hypothetical protein